MFDTIAIEPCLCGHIAFQRFLSGNGNNIVKINRTSKKILVINEVIFRRNWLNRGSTVIVLYLTK